MGVPGVYVVDPNAQRVHCYYPDRQQESLNVGDEFVGVGALSGWRIPVGRFFESSPK